MSFTHESNSNSLHSCVFYSDTIIELNKWLMTNAYIIDDWFIQELKSKF